MGDISERKCVEVYGKNLVKFGLDRPPLQVHRLPTRIRYTPDFLGSTEFVEVQGCGKDQVFKFKLEKVNCLLWWNDLHPVVLFLYDSHNDRWATIPLNAVLRWIDEGRATLGWFPERKAYWAVNAETVFAADLGKRN